jgi:hypothetical protein
MTTNPKKKQLIEFLVPFFQNGPDRHHNPEIAAEQFLLLFNSYILDHLQEIWQEDIMDQASRCDKHKSTGPCPSCPERFLGQPKDAIVKDT